MCEQKRQKILDALSDEALEDYLTAEYGGWLCLWEDGYHCINDSSYTLVYDIQPIGVAKCPGIGNLDSTMFSDGFAYRNEEDGMYYTLEDNTLVGDLAELIHDCVVNGDVTGFMDDLVEQLMVE